MLLLLSRFSPVWLCATPIDGSPPGSAIPGILQARVLEWGAIAFSFVTWAPPKKVVSLLLPHDCVHWSAARGENIACLLLWLDDRLLLWQERRLLWPLCQPGERLCCVILCHGCCPERINMSAVPTAPRVFFQPLSSCLAFPGFSEQCEQQWHHEQISKTDVFLT